MVRKATTDDLQALSQLFDAYRVFYEKESDVAAAASFLNDRLTKGDAVIFVSVVDGEITGFTQLYPLYSSTRMKPLWLLNDLYVKPMHRGQGHSIALIDAAKKLAIDTDAAGLILETAKTNDVGNQLYPKTGFVCDHDHNYYSWDV